MNNQQGNLNQSKYIKINNHFFVYYNRDPLKNNNNFIRCLTKVISIIIHIFLLIAVISLIFDKQNPDKYLYFFIIICVLFTIIILIGLYIYNCRKLERLRIDIIYSFNFDKIFIGTSYDNENYCTTFELFINEIDRFILRKNEINDKGFYLYVIFKGNSDKELCYIKDQQEELEGLLYILNKKVTGSNNTIEQQNLSECPPPKETPGN